MFSEIQEIFQWFDICKKVVLASDAIEGKLLPRVVEAINFLATSIIVHLNY